MILTGSFLTVDKFGDKVPESASVSPFDDITLGRGLSDHHSPASQTKTQTLQSNWNLLPIGTIL